MTDTLLDIQDLQVHFHTEIGTVEALDGISMDIGHNEVLGVIGESGCGKSVTALSIMGLLQSPPAEIVAGKIEYDGQNLLNLPRKEMDHIRGNDLSMIYQDPMTSLNPVLTIGHQLMEPLLAHTDCSKVEGRSRAVEMLDACGLADPDRLMNQYPNELSGGMRQRVVIAMALVTEPKLLIADEPTTALDVTIQAQIMELLQDLQDRFDMSVLFISHDLGVVSDIADRVAVMYAGTVAESCSINQLFENPLHPYSRALAESIPTLEKDADRLPTIDGIVPDLHDPPTGCRFASRCPQYIGDVCNKYDPKLTSCGVDHDVACHLYTETSKATPPWQTPAPTVSDDIDKSPDDA
ncbi:ABC transporter ATP-binding protein [Halocatena marina]|uniref:ABC transporter ATP-binding protein n=1 Tax=Halocatena marina TaxID=2934937 RepID=UPI00200E08DD|nr:ABC transporter ATP-binding protein [Halocatena marina]